jgi:5-formyltetrahydrofolate cyclo-ligase
MEDTPINKASPSTTSLNNPRQIYKSKLRVQLRAKRRQLSPQQQSQAARQLDKQVAQSGLIGRHQSIALYFAEDGEIDPAPLLKRLLKLRCQCFLPIIRANGSLLFARYRRGDKLRLNHFGIAEPTKRRKLRRAQHISLLLLPLVGFDRRGGRLGMGGGFYDRSLKANRQDSRSPRLIGLAHSCQEIDQLVVDQWDIPLAQVITERETIRC